MTSEEPRTATDCDGESGPEGCVALTRRRWDWYFLPAVAIAVVLSVALSWTSGQLRPLAGPLLLLLLVWVWLRVRTPTTGIRTRTVSATPGMPQLLAWCAFILVLLAGGIAMDIIIFGQRFNEPVRPYHVALTVLLMLLLIGGGWIIERRYRRPPA